MGVRSDDRTFFEFLVENRSGTYALAIIAYSEALVV